MQDIDVLVASLVGKSTGEILIALNTAAGAADRPRRGRHAAALARDAEALRYAGFAKGALFALFHAPGRAPAGVSAGDFDKLRPLVENLIARKLAPAEWLRMFEAEKR